MTETNPPPRRKWTDFDWIWNTITVGCLVLGGTFATDTVQAFSQGQWDLLQTFGTIGQGAGLVFVTGGALTDRGRQGIKLVLTSLGIAPAYQAEVTCAFAAVTLAATYGVNQSLPRLGDYYYRQGQQFYNAGQTASAVASFHQALNFDPNDVRVTIALGNYFEKIRDHEAAQKFYLTALPYGEPAAFSGMGRAIMRQDTSLQGLEAAELYFQFALSQAQLQPELKASILTHLGFVYVQQADLIARNPISVAELREVSMIQSADPVGDLQRRSEQLLRSAIALTDINPAPWPGKGMAYCYLAALLDQTDRPQEAQGRWEDCANRAIPASSNQYEDILNYGGLPILDRVNTSGIVTRYAHDN